MSIVSDNSFLDPHSECCFINQTPVVEVEGRQPTTSVSNTVAAAKIEIGGDESSPTGFEGKEKSCKRPVSDRLKSINRPACPPFKFSKFLCFTYFELCLFSFYFWKLLLNRKTTNIYPILKGRYNQRRVCPRRHFNSIQLETSVSPRHFSSP